MTKKDSPRQRVPTDLNLEIEQEIRAKRLKIANEPSAHPPKENVVVSTNKLASDDFESKCIPQSMLRHQRNPSSADLDSVESFDIMFAYARDVPQSVLEQGYKLIETTSRSDYEDSTLGWRPKHKKKEMRQSEMRYLTAWRTPDAAKHDDSRKDDHSEENRDFQGFLSFMVTHEAGCAVLYIYEIHLAASARGKGLGQHLMGLVEAVAHRLGPSIEKVMLTCFVANTHAVEFYRKSGFIIDDSSPEARQTRGKLIEPEYLIMSKSTKGNRLPHDLAF
jgi:ribosomal protein S18 acetylase RimI-like enzyme